MEGALRCGQLTAIGPAVKQAMSAPSDAPVVAQGVLVQPSPPSAEVATAEPVAQPPVVVSALPQGQHGPKECRGCGVTFTPPSGTSTASAQFMRCSKCNSVGNMVLGALKFW